MRVFDIQVPDEELKVALESTYQTDLAILKCDFEFHCSTPRRRLALATVSLQTHTGVRTLGILVKESSKHELIVLSLMSKLLPFSCPKVFYYVETDSAMWLLLENITTWVNIDGQHRVNETLVDGLYVIQAALLHSTQLLLDNFKTFPVITKEVLLRTGLTSLSQVDEMSRNDLFVECFADHNWDQVKVDVEGVLKEVKDCAFLKTVVHGHYYPNTARAVKDARGRTHVVVYDWQNAAIGWPQIDLVVLLDRLDILAEYQGVPGPSPILLQRYITGLIDEFDIDPKLFYKVYRVCYLCRMLPLMRWWMQKHLQRPSHDPERVFLEIRTKLKKMVSDLQEWGKEG